MAEPDSQSLQRALAALHTELARNTRLDDASRTALRGALSEIGGRLAQPDAAPAPAAASRRLDALAVGFETDHPALAASVRQFIELLGQAGL